MRNKTIEKRRIDIMEGVWEEHIYESLKNNDDQSEEATSLTSFLVQRFCQKFTNQSYIEGRKNYMRVK